MPSKPRKPIADMIEELKSWLPNYDHGPTDYPTLLWRILASLPGGEQAEDMGYETFQLGWQEVEQLGNVLAAIQDKRDVEDLVAGLLADGEEGEVDEARRRNHPPYGDKRDYPKIDIYVDGQYVATTTWASTVKQAVEQYVARNNVGSDRVTAYFQESRHSTRETRNPFSRPVREPTRGRTELAARRPPRRR